MKSIKIVFLVLISQVLGIHTSFSQLNLIGEYRVRGEFTNGYKKPLNLPQKPGGFVSHRARLGLTYNHKRFQFNFAVQDVRTFGSHLPLGIENKGALSLHEANVDIFFSKKWSLKVGRQPIKYDNGILFDDINWTMQSLRHDAAIVKFRDSTWSVDVGGAYNQESSSFVDVPYTLNNYKTFQYAWGNKTWEKFSLSLIFLNNGVEQQYYEDSIEKRRINFLQTMGGYFKYNLTKFDFSGFGYYQTGYTENRIMRHAYSFGLEINYKPHKDWKLTLGNETYSGNSQQAPPNSLDYSFWTMYGGGHAHNGFMDYFYSSNHKDDVGLVNGYLKLEYNFKKFNFLLANHLFFAAANVVNLGFPSFSENMVLNPFMGYEMDFRFQYKIFDEVSIETGYSHFFGTSTLLRVKGGDKLHSNWAYIMISVQPFKNLPALF